MSGTFMFGSVGNNSMGWDWRLVVNFAISYHKETGIKCRVKRNKYGVWRAYPLVYVNCNPA